MIDSFSHGVAIDSMAVYLDCPSGPSQPPADGVSVMGDEEHEQWAPMGGGGGWVIVGMRGHNTAVQCLTHENLYGADVEVDLPKDKKHHIMCCGG